MTGRGGGFCVLKLPDRPGEPLFGTAGRAGWPVGWVYGDEDELTRLRYRARQIETMLHAIRNRIERLQAARQQEPPGVLEQGTD